MAVARDVRERDGVDGCEIGIGTQANLQVLTDLGPTSATRTPGDVVIAVDAQDGAGEEALDAAERGIASAEDDEPARSAPEPDRSPRSPTRTWR